MAFKSDSRCPARTKLVSVRPLTRDHAITAREVLHEELKLRFFTERPSNLRLVQMYMSKQDMATNWMPEAWLMDALAGHLLGEPAIAHGDGGT